MPAEPFIGEVAIFGFNFAPQNWAQCNGQLLSIAQNTALFSLLGTTYGGDGRVTFALPDLRGRLPMHTGQGAGLTNREQGEAAGSEAVTLQLSQMPTHSHLLRVATANGSSASPAGASPARSSQSDKVYGAASGSAMASETLTTSGGSQPHSNMPPYLVLNFCISLVGIYPTRD
jgi:microcystin-dependent protein